MTQNHNMNAGFRAGLKNEIPLWVEENILTEEVAKRLSDKYQLDSLTQESSNLLSAVVFTIGSILLGGGVITFVAANWDRISVPVKLMILFTVLLGFHLAGYFLRYIKGWGRLGHALIFCGCLVFGANVGLIAQIFHLQSNWYGGFGAWALGSLAMAWAIRSWLIGLLVLVTSFIWFAGFGSDYHERAATVYPFALAATLMSLAWIIRSRVLYAATLLGVIIASCVLSVFYPYTDVNGKLWLAILIAAGFFAWALGEVHKVIDRREEFADTTSGVGLSVLAYAAYISTFHDIWDKSSNTKISLLLIVFVALSLAELVILMRSERKRTWLLAGVSCVAALLFLCAMLSGINPNTGEVLFTLISNIAALSLGAIIIGIGLSEDRRAPFWLGALYVVLIILSRFLEYDTSLLLKSAAFLICGVLVIAAGVSYEISLRKKSNPNRLETKEANV